MPDIYLDVDIDLSEVPVNIYPLVDDTDFKTRETAVTYNATGMDLVWNFITTGGVFTQTAVTPTTGGVYDWTNQGDGMYTIEIPATGGGTINNNTEGFGWFTGVATGVMPWRGPVMGFRAAGLNDKLIDDAYSTYRGLAGTALPLAIADDASGLPIKSSLATTTTLTDAVWDELLSGHAISGSTGAALSTAGSGSSAETIASAVWDSVETGHTDAGKAGAKLWTDIPAILADTGTDGVVLAANAITAAKIATDAITAAKIADGAIDAATFAAGAITAAAIAADAIGASELAADAVAEIADAVWDELSTGHTDAGKAGQQMWTDVDAVLADTNELQVDWVNGGRLDLLLDGMPAAVAAYTLTEPANLASKTVGAMLWHIYARFYQKNTQSPTQQITYKADGSTALGTRATSDTGSLQTIGAAA